MARLHVKFSHKVVNWYQRALSCCSGHDNEEEYPKMVISEPTNFRREDISIPGLTEGQQRWIREKAIADASSMSLHRTRLEKSTQSLHPLRSNPTSANDLRAYTQPRHHSSNMLMPPSPSERCRRKGECCAAKPEQEECLAAPMSTPAREGRLERIKRHSRKISDSFVKPLNSPIIGGVSAGLGVTRYHAVRSASDSYSGSTERKLSHDSDSSDLATFTSEEDRDSALGGMGRK